MKRNARLLFIIGFCLFFDFALFPQENNKHSEKSIIEGVWATAWARTMADYLFIGDSYQIRRWFDLGDVVHFTHISIGSFSINGDTITFYEKIYRRDRGGMEGTGLFMEENDDGSLMVIREYNAKYSITGQTLRIDSDELKKTNSLPKILTREEIEKIIWF